MSSAVGPLEMQAASRAWFDARLELPSSSALGVPDLEPFLGSQALGASGCRA